MKKTALVIGASHAGAQVVTSLRQEGWDGDIVLIGEEPHLPYHRPPLSKTFWQAIKPLPSWRFALQLFMKKMTFSFAKAV